MVNKLTCLVLVSIIGIQTRVRTNCQQMKDSDEHRSSIGKMSAENQKLHTTIRNLEKDISDLKSEIKSRDDTIADKERRITDLKRSALELEKHR